MAPLKLVKHDSSRGGGQLLYLLHRAKRDLIAAEKLADQAPFNRNPLLKTAIAQLQEREQYGFEQRAAVGGATTAQSGWASELSPSPGIFRDVFTAVQGRSLALRVLANAPQTEFNLPTPKETGSAATVNWRGESLAAVTLKSTTGLFTLKYREIGGFLVLTIEMDRMSSPTGQAQLSRLAPEAIVGFLDQQFFDPTITATSSRPASITNGAQPVTSTGSTASAIAADLSSMIELMQILSNGDGWMFCMRPTTYFSIAAKFAAVGLPITPGFLVGIPVLLGSKSPKQITLVDTSNIAWATDGQVVLDLSSEASAEMVDSPTQSGVAGTGASLVSFWQSGLVGIRAALGINWQTIRYATGSPTVSAACTFMSVAY
jgi:HK97 family phage major capsid protein